MAKTESYVAVAALQSLAANTVYVGADQDMSGKYGGILTIQFARAVTTALTAGVKFRVEMRKAAAGNMAWGLLCSFVTAIATAIRLAVTTQSAASQKELTMSSTTGYALTDRVFVENAVLANSEFHEVSLIHASTHLTVEENLANIQEVTAFVANSAERYECAIPMECKCFRLVVDNDANGVAVYFKADLVQVDTIV
jgi:hypothetical protein